MPLSYEPRWSWRPGRRACRVQEDALRVDLFPWSRVDRYGVRYEVRAPLVDAAGERVVAYGEVFAYDASEDRETFYIVTALAKRRQSG